MFKKAIAAVCLVLAVLFYFNRGVFMSYSVYDFYGKNQQALAEAIWQKDVDKVAKLAPDTDLHSLSKKNMSLLMLPIVRIVEDLQGDNSAYYQIITLLVKNGADPDQEQGKTGNSSPLTTALLPDAPPAMLEALLKGGLDPNYKQKELMDTPIIFETINDYDHEKFKLFIDYGADFNVKRGKTPLIIGTAINGAKNTLYILERGADLYAVGLNGLTVPYVIYANIEDSIQSIKSIEEGKSVFGPNDRDTTILKRILKDEEKVRDFLIKKGIKWPSEVPPQIKKNMEEAKKYKKQKYFNTNY